MIQPSIEKICWAISATGQEVGNAAGYGRSNVLFRAALERIGVEIDDSADVAIHYGYAGLFRPRPGKWNALFTMYESPYVPPEMIEAIRIADQVIVPSRYCAELFARFTTRPISVCPLGVDLHVFRPRERSWRQGKDRFRWLYVGAPNYRKMTILPELHRALLADLPCELYVKTTGALRTPEMLKSFDAWACEIISDGDIIRSHNWTVDNRAISPAALAEIYHSAHGFLFLHCGEGFGLTGLEAMATGLAPVISDSTGTQDFADKSCAYLVDAPIQPVRQLDSDGVEFSHDLPWPDAVASMRAVGLVMTDYFEARRRGRAAAARAKEFSWEAAARTLCDSLRDEARLAPSTLHVALCPQDKSVA